MRSDRHILAVYSIAVDDYVWGLGTRLLAARGGDDGTQKFHRNPAGVKSDVARLQRGSQ